MAGTAACLVALLPTVGCGAGGGTPQAAAPIPSSSPAPTITPTTPAAIPTRSPPTRAPVSAATPKAGSKDFGYLTAVLSKDPVTLSFDRAVFLTGDAAVTAAAAHHDEAFDFYIQNDNTLLRSLVLAPDVQVAGSLQLNTFAGHESVELRPQTVTALLGFLGTKMGTTTPFHLVYGAGGTVTRVEEQYLP